MGVDEQSHDMFMQALEGWQKSSSEPQTVRLDANTQNAY